MPGDAVARRGGLAGPGRRQAGTGKAGVRLADARPRGVGGVGAPTPARHVAEAVGARGISGLLIEAKLCREIDSS